MTRAPRRPPLAFEDVDDIAAALRARGGRLSAARRLVLESLFAADRPVSAEELAGGLGGRTGTSDLASVYRNLEHLEELGVVRHLHVGHGPGLYTLERGAHEYLVCERCGRVDRVEAERLDGARAAIREAFGYDARFDHFPVVGLCPDCAASGGAEPHAHPHPHGHGHAH